METWIKPYFSRALLADTDAFLLPLGLCRPLELAEVKEATLVPSPTNSEGQKFSVLELQLALSVSQAVFQATIALSTTTSPPSMHTVTLTRMDWYSATSSCLPSIYPHLRPYCICY